MEMKRKKKRQRLDLNKSALPNDTSNEKEPNSFSKIDPSSLHAQTCPCQFPNLGKATKITFQLNAGEMLYLPASWFHEVTSYSPRPPESPIHIAFNYWMHPPTTSDFDSPYQDDYWLEKWTEIEPVLKKLKAI